VFVLSFGVFPSAILLGSRRGTRTIAIGAYQQFEHTPCRTPRPSRGLGLFQLAASSSSFLFRRAIGDAPTLGVGKALSHREPVGLRTRTSGMNAWGGLGEGAAPLPPD